MSDDHFKRVLPYGCVSSVTGYRRAAAMRVWQAMQAVAAVVAITRVYQDYADDLYEGRYWGPVDESRARVDAVLEALGGR